MEKKYSVVLHPKSEKEYLDSVEWYEQALIGLGKDFTEEVGVVIEQIKQNPFLFQKRKLNFREGVVKRFPYVIIYKIDEKQQIVNVLSVFHTSRHPKKKTKSKG